MSLISRIFGLVFLGNLIDAHIVGTAVMPILQLLDLTCCSKACDAKPVVKLGDWMVQIFLGNALNIILWGCSESRVPCA